MPDPTRKTPRTENRYRVVNVDRLHALPGQPSEHDFAVVYDDATADHHPIIGTPQARQVFSGSLKECHDWVQVKVSSDA